MYCMCLPAFIVTSADKSQLWVSLLIYCLRSLLFRTFNVWDVVDIVLHNYMHKLLWSFVLVSVFIVYKHVMFMVCW